VTYSWDFGNGQVGSGPNPKATFNEADSVTVTLIVTDSLGCRDTVSQTFWIDYSPVIFIPNAFTPNGDGDNDLFVIKGVAIKELTFRVFSRQGQVILETNNVDFITRQGWNGVYNSVKIPTGTYVYTAQGLLLDGKPFYYKGFITVFY
jgi:gliding motility-associated-like protein